MFTGIVQGMAQVVECQGLGSNKRLQIQFPESSMQSQQLGASVSINGVCLTVVAVQADLISFDVIDTTLTLTNLGLLAAGSIINFERAAKMGDEVGGHIMSGHIMCCLTVSQIRTQEDSHRLRFSIIESSASEGVLAANHPMSYLFNKGYVGLNGSSLTICDIGDNWIEVSLIPETLRLTTFGALKVDDNVNLEIDSHTQATVDTVERILQQKGLV